MADRGIQGQSGIWNSIVLSLTVKFSILDDNERDGIWIALNNAFPRSES